MRPVLQRTAVATLAVVAGGFALSNSEALAQRAGWFFDQRAAAGIGAEGTGGRTSPEETIYSYTQRPAYPYVAPSTPSYTQRRVYRYVAGSESAPSLEHRPGATGVSAQRTGGASVPPAAPHPLYQDNGTKGGNRCYYPGYYSYPARSSRLFSSFPWRHRHR